LLDLRRDRQAATRSRLAVALLASTILLALSGCGAGRAPSTVSVRPSSEPRFTPEPFTHQQELVEQGARLVVSDGCSACHLTASSQRIAPSFASFAGQDVTLTDGQRVLVDEHFLREALLDPRNTQIKGYDPAPMLTAIERLHLSGQPEQIAALAAFIEQIGPEPE
jgi:hypothetical protein